MKTLPIKEIAEKGQADDKLKNKLGHKCVYCNCENRLLLTIDHKTPLCRGGKDEDSNKHICCIICNQLKGGLKHDEFKKELKALYIMHDLCKVRLPISKVELVFRLKHHPEWLPSVPPKEVNNETK